MNTCKCGRELKSQDEILKKQCIKCWLGLEPEPKEDNGHTNTV